MTFFDWHSTKGESKVSSEIWIYFVIATGLTLIMIGLWFRIMQRAHQGGRVIASGAV